MLHFQHIKKTQIPSDFQSVMRVSNASDFQDGLSKNQNNSKLKREEALHGKGKCCCKAICAKQESFCRFIWNVFGAYPREILENFVSSYKINLVMAEDIEDINHFRTDLQYIFGMLKCRKSKEKLVNYTNENSEYFHCVDGESYLAISELLHSEKLLKNSVKREEMEDGVDMCGAPS